MTKPDWYGRRPKAPPLTNRWLTMDSNEDPIDPVGASWQRVMLIVASAIGIGFVIGQFFN